MGHELRGLRKTPSSKTTVTLLLFWNLGSRAEGRSLLRRRERLTHTKVSETHTHIHTQTHSFTPTHWAYLTWGNWVWREGESGEGEVREKIMEAVGGPHIPAQCAPTVAVSWLVA